MAVVELILLQRVEKLGQMGEVVKVKPGYARNFLLPQKKALRANKANRATFEGQRAQLEAQNLKRREEAERLSERMAGLSVVIIRQAGESGSLPMIPILSGIIAGQGQHLTKGRAFVLSLSYVLGMAITYALVGIAAGLSGSLLSHFCKRHGSKGTGNTL